MQRRSEASFTAVELGGDQELLEGHHRCRPSSDLVELRRLHLRSRHGDVPADGQAGEALVLLQPIDDALRLDGPHAGN